jgi:hypothetical protein
VGLILGAERGEGRPGLSLAELGAAVDRARDEAVKTGADLDQIFPAVRTTVGGKPKLKIISIEIP